VDVSDRAEAFIEDVVIPFQLAKVRENQNILKAYSAFVAKFGLDGSGREESAGSFQPSRWLLECLVPGPSLFKGNGEFYVKALSEATSLDDVITADNKLLFHQVPTPYVMAAFCFIEDLESQLEAVANTGEEVFDRARTWADRYFENKNSDANPSVEIPVASSDLSKSNRGSPEHATPVTPPSSTPTLLTPDPGSSAAPSPSAPTSDPPTRPATTAPHEGAIGPTSGNSTELPAKGAAQQEERAGGSEEDDLTEFPSERHSFIIAYTFLLSDIRFILSCSRVYCRI
jgi:hypothetical protein